MAPGVLCRWLGPHHGEVASLSLPRTKKKLRRAAWGSLYEMSAPDVSVAVPAASSCASVLGMKELVLQIAGFVVDMRDVAHLAAAAESVHVLLECRPLAKLRAGAFIGPHVKKLRDLDAGYDQAESEAIQRNARAVEAAYYDSITTYKCIARAEKFRGIDMIMVYQVRVGVACASKEQHREWIEATEDPAQLTLETPGGSLLISTPNFLSLTDVLVQNPRMSLRISAHETLYDPRSSDNQWALRTTQRIAFLLMKWLYYPCPQIPNMGMNDLVTNRASISVDGFGNTRPLTRMFGDDYPRAAANRRIEFHVKWREAGDGFELPLRPTNDRPGQEAALYFSAVAGLHEMWYRP